MPSSFSILYTKFPYRTFSVTNGHLKFRRAEKALFFSITRVVHHGQPGTFFLRGIGNLLGRSGKGAVRAVLGILERSLSCCIPSPRVMGTVSFKIPRRHREICVMKFHGSRGIERFACPSPVSGGGAFTSMGRRGAISTGCCLSARCIGALVTRGRHRTTGKGNFKCRVVPSGNITGTVIIKKVNHRHGLMVSGELRSFAPIAGVGKRMGHSKLEEVAPQR